MKANKLKENKPESLESVWEKAFADMCAGLDKYGPDEILRILIANSHHDIVCRDLLLTYPQVVATGKFLSNFRFTVKVSKRLFKKLQREGCII